MNRSFHLIAPVALAATSFAGAQTELEEPTAEHQLPAVSLMPVGSILTKVVLPRYDAHRQLISSLRAEELTVIDTHTLRGEAVTLQLFKPDRTPRAQAELKTAIFDQSSGTLESRDPIEVRSETFNAKGSGLSYAYQQNEGFLFGPVVTRIAEPQKKETSMNFPLTPQGAASALAIVMLSMPATADVPGYLTPEEQTAMEKDAASVASDAAIANQETERSISSGRELSEKANQALLTFAKQAAIASISIDSTTGSEASADTSATATSTLPPAAPLEINAGPNDTIIESDGGMYFDATKGVLVYLKNVRLKDPRLTLTGANELKIFLSKKAPANGVESGSPEAPKAPKSASGLAGAAKGFGDVDRIIATGAVRIVYSSSDGNPPVEASASTLTYNFKANEIILDGGYPWIKQGDKFMRAKQPNLYIRIKEDGSFVTEPGQWDMGGKIQQTSPARR